MTSAHQWEAIHYLVDGAIVESCDGVVLTVNAAFKQMFDLEVDGFVDRPIDDIEQAISAQFNKADELVTSAAIARDATTAATTDVFRLVDGRSIERDCVRIVDEDENITEGYLWIFRDVTEREALAVALKDVTTVQNAIIEASGDGILIVNNDGYVIDLNSTAKQMLNLDVIPQRMNIIELFPPALRETAMARLEKVRRENRPLTMMEANDTVIRTADGSYLSVAFGISPIAMGRTLLLAIFVRDVSDRRAWEIRLGIQEAMARSVAAAASILMRIEDEEIAVQEALKSLGWASRVDRVYVSELYYEEPDQTLRASMIHEWAAPGVKPRKGIPETTRVVWHNNFHRWLTLLQSGLPVVGIVDEMPEAEAAIFRARGMASVLAVPILNEGKWWGVLGFECAIDRAWTSHEIHILHSMAGILMAAVTMKRK